MWIDCRYSFRSAKDAYGKDILYFGDYDPVTLTTTSWGVREQGNFNANQQDEFVVENLPDGYYKWTVSCTDELNTTFADENRTFEAVQGLQV